MKYLLQLISVFTFLALSACGQNDNANSGKPLDEATIASIVTRHNYYRNEVGVPDIVWSASVAKSAQSWANQLGRNCDFEHSDGPYGENLWMGTSDAFTPNDVVDSWGAEKEDYTYADNSCTDVCGHYTQMVWATTTKVGCAMVTCDGSDIWVCQYDPPGNYVGEKPY